MEGVLRAAPPLPPLQALVLLSTVMVPQGAANPQAADRMTPCPSLRAFLSAFL